MVSQYVMDIIKFSYSPELYLFFFSHFPNQFFIIFINKHITFKTNFIVIPFKLISIFVII